MEEHDDVPLLEYDPITGRFHPETPAMSLPPSTAAPTVYRSCRKYASIFWRSFKDMAYHKMNFLLGCASCFVVIVVVALLQTIIVRTPTVFTRLAELGVGQQDVQLLASPPREFINYTAFESFFQNTPLETLHTARFVVPSSAFGLGASCSRNEWSPLLYTGTKDDPCLSSDPTDCLQPCPGMPSSMYIIQPDREEEMHLGNPIPHLSPGHCIVESHLAHSLHVQVGDTLLVSLYAPRVFGSIWTSRIDLSWWDRHFQLEQAMGRNRTENPYAWNHVLVPFTISALLDEPMGKYGSDVDNGILVSMDGFWSHMMKHVHPELPKPIHQALEKHRLRDTVERVIVNFPHRKEVYLESNVDVIRANAMDFTQEMLYKAGFQHLETSLPIVDGLNAIVYVMLFMGLLVQVITWTLVALSILLMYSLLMMHVEQRMFDFGMLRSMGMSKRLLVVMMISQAMTYALPSIFVGLWTAQWLMQKTSVLFFSLAGVTIPTDLSLYAMVSAVSMGLLVPLVSVLLPIRSVLQRNLVAHLQPHRTAVQAIEFHLERSTSTSWIALVVGLCAAIFGFFMYYLFPLALMSTNIGLLLDVFFLVLISMLLGLVMLSLNMLSLVEKGVAYVFFRLFSSEAGFTMLLHNLIAHRKRNLKTSIMYASTIAFIIFLSSTYHIQVSSVLHRLEAKHGARLEVYNHWYESFLMENLTALDQVLDRPYVRGHTWVPLELRRMIPIQDVVLSPLGHVYTDFMRVRGMSPGYLQRTRRTYVQHSKGASGFEALYGVNGSSKVILGSSYEQTMHLDVSSEVLVQWRPYEANERGKHVVKGTPLVLEAAGFFDRLPGLYVSPLRRKHYQDALVSYPTYVRLAERWRSLHSVDDLPMAKLQVQLDPDVSTEDVDALVASLYGFYQGYSHIHIWNFQHAEGNVAIIDLAMGIFFNFAAVVSMIICFFSLVASTLGNVMAHASDIHMLQALGMTKRSIQATYVQESFVLVFGASILGCFIGSFVAYVIAAQQLLFTQVPTEFVFPWTLVALLFGASAVSAFASYLGPVRFLVRS